MIQDHLKEIYSKVKESQLNPNIEPFELTSPYLAKVKSEIKGDQLDHEYEEAIEEAEDPRDRELLGLWELFSPVSAEPWDWINFDEVC